MKVIDFDGGLIYEGVIGKDTKAADKVANQEQKTEVVEKTK